MGIDNIALLFPGDDIVEKLVITDLGNGMFTATGPSSTVSVVDTAFSIDSLSAIDNGNGTFTVSSE